MSEKNEMLWMIGTMQFLRTQYWNNTVFILAQRFYPSDEKY